MLEKTLEIESYPWPTITITTAIAIAITITITISYQNSVSFEQSIAQPYHEVRPERV